ncbi:MAG: DUF6069 family protein, partial [Dehalococcoidia bacterium]
GLLAAAVAAVGNVVVYALARALGVSLIMPLTPGAAPALLPVGMVILMSVGGAVAGTVAFALLGRFMPRGVPLFQIVGIVFLLLSFGGPLSLNHTNGATKATLMLMHTVAGGSIIGLLGGFGRRSPQGGRGLPR